MRNEGVGSWTARRVRMSPDRDAIVYDDHRCSYRSLHERATRLAHVLGGRGVGHGDRVAYLGRNHPAFLEALFGVGQRGAVFVPLNWRLTAPELAYILADCGAGLLLFAPEHAATVSKLGQVPAIAVDQEYERLLAAARTDPLDEAVAPDETCMIMYTSGTTGRPRGVMLTHANVTWNCVNVMIDIDVGGDETTLVPAPMFHVAALNQTVLPTLLRGGRVVLMSAFDPAAALDLIARYRVTYVFGVPTMFLAMARVAGWAQADLSSLRRVLCGGAPVPEAVIATYQKRGVTFLQGYGLTEAAPNVLVLRRDDSVRKAGTAGTAAFFTDVRLVRPDGGAAAPGEPGEILVRGPNVMAGYWRRPEDTEAVLTPDGWLRTGDLGVADGEGFVAIRDRIKDVIISGGENIYPAEVEDALYQHPAVAECAVIAVPDATWGEVGRAVVVPCAGAVVTPEELLGFLSGRIARFKIPKSVVFADALPRTASGKDLKYELRTRYG